MGGKRQGAGRPTAPPRLKKRMISVRLPEWLLAWLSQQTESQAVLIEDALKEKHRLKPPDVT